MVTSYPITIWDGDSSNRNSNAAPKKAPDHRDWTRMIGEVVATQIELDTEKVNIDTLQTDVNQLQTETGQVNTVTETLYVDSNRIDSYTENGSIMKPFKTIQAAVIAANTGNYILNIAPGTYVGDVDLGVGVTTVRGSGLNATIFTGNMTAGDRAHTLTDFRITSTGSLTITDSVNGQNLNLNCAVIVSGSGNLEAAVIFIDPPTNIVPLTMSAETGTIIISRGFIIAVGNINAVTQSQGTVVFLDSYITNNSPTTVTINSTNGILGIVDTPVLNAGLGDAISMENSGSALAPNTLRGIICLGNITCGDAHTIIDGLTFMFGTLSGNNLIYRPASQLDNDSSVTGTTIKDALDTLDTRVTALESA